MLGNGGFRFDTGWLLLFFLEFRREKFVDSSKISLIVPKCREIGIDRLRNGQLLRRALWKVYATTNNEVCQR